MSICQLCHQEFKHTAYSEAKYCPNCQQKGWGGDFKNRLIKKEWDKHKAEITMAELAVKFNMPLEVIYRILSNTIKQRK